MPAAKKKTVKPKKKKVVQWKAISHEVYTDVIEHCVHFSSRPANTNATPVGVRLGAKNPLPLPYLAVSTVGSNKVQTDYLRNGGTEAGPFKQIRAVLEGRLDEFSEVNPADVKHINEVSGGKAGFEFRSANVDPRLRQILWPLGDDDYLSLTPLPSAGLSLIINSRVGVENDAAKQRHEESNKKSWTLFYKRSALGIGGANSQNAGGLVYTMTRPLVFDAPKEKPEIRLAVAAYHKGIRYQYSRPLLNEYGAWLYTRRGRATPKSDLRTRNQARRLIHRIANDVLSRADSAREHIAKTTFLNGYCSPELSEVQQGFLNPGLRSSSWCRAMAAELARAIGKHRFRVNGEKDLVSVALNDAETGVIAGYIEELVR